MEQVESETEKKKKIRPAEYGYFLIQREYGGIKTLADIIGVSEKMIRLYLEDYWVYGKGLKRKPRKPGAFTAFSFAMSEADRRYKEKLRSICRRKGLDFNVTLECLLESLEKDDNDV